MAAAAAGPCWCERIEWRHGHSDIGAERPINTSSQCQADLEKPSVQPLLALHRWDRLQFFPAVPKKNLQQGSRRNPAVLAVSSLFA